MVYPENKAADEHFENLRNQYSNSVSRAKELVDEATETNRFIGESLKVSRLWLRERNLHRPVNNSVVCSFI